MNDALDIQKTIKAIGRLEATQAFPQLEHRFICAKLLLSDILVEIAQNAESLTDILLIIQSGDSKIARVKKARDFFSLGFKDAKEFVERYFADNGTGDLIE